MDDTGTAAKPKMVTPPGE